MRSGRLPLFRTAFVVCAVGAVACIVLTVYLWRSGDVGGVHAGILGFPLAAASTLLTGVTVWLGQKSVPGPDIAAAVQKVSMEVRQQRAVFLDGTLGTKSTVGLAAATVSNPDPETFGGPAERQLSRRQPAAGVRRATVATLESFYSALPEGRMVLLGAPGSGKSVALSQLALDLVGKGDAERDQHSRIPLVLDIANFEHFEHTTAECIRVDPDRLRDWIVEVLVRDYHVTWRTGSDLIQQDRVLPVFDGLDELAPDPQHDAAGGRHWDTEYEHRDVRGATSHAKAAAFVDALNSGWRSPVVVACRTNFYRSLTSSAAPLADAEHVVIDRLAPDTVDQYAVERLGARDAAVWKARYDLPGGDEVLAVPLYLSLALQIYESNPAGRLTGVVSGAADLKCELLKAFVGSAVEGSQEATLRGWTAGDVTRWLSAVATVQDSVLESNGLLPGGKDVVPDIHLPDLWLASEKRMDRRIARGLPAVLAGAPAILLGALLCITGPIGLIVGVLSIVAGVRLLRLAYRLEAPVKRIDLRLLRSASGRRAVALALRKGLVHGAALGAVGIATGRVLRDRVTIPGARLLAFGGFAAVVGATVSTIVTAGGSQAKDELLSGAAVGAAVGAGAGLAVGLINGMVVAAATALSHEVATVPTSRALVRQGVAYSLTVAVLGLVAWAVSVAIIGSILVTWLMPDLLDDATRAVGGASGGVILAVTCAAIVGVGGGWINAIGQGCGYVWIRYWLGVMFGAWRGVLPLRPATFLDWCVDVGLMRRSGTTVQFRHRDFHSLVRDWQDGSGEVSLQSVPGFRAARRYGRRFAGRS